MARKTLLTESEIRRFMKLASVPAIGNSRLREWNGVTEIEEEDPMADVKGEEEESADVDLTAEEAEVIIGLGEKLKAEIGDEDEDLEGDMPDMSDVAPEGAPAMPPMPPDEAGPVMQEAFVRELSSRVAQRVAHEHAINEEVNRRVTGHLRKEQIINETMKRVARRLSPRRS